jgi:ankyrin repeat protein
MLTLSRDDPWDVGGSFVASYHEQEIAKYRLNEADARTAEWRACDCRDQLCEAEQILRSDSFRLEEGLKPWALMVVTMGAAALTDDAGCTPLHWVARSGTWYALPESALTADAVLQPNLANETPFEIAARNQTLQQIASEALRTLAISRTRANDTPLHHAARGGYLLILPPVIKTDDLLALEDADGCSVFDRHRAASRASGHGENNAA